MKKRHVLNVPLYYQPLHSALCGAASARMVSAFHGIHRPLINIAKTMHVTKNGVTGPAVGIWFLNLGFKVTIIGHIDEWPHRFIDLPEKNINKEIQRWSKRQQKSPDDARRMFGKLFPVFLNTGGSLAPRPVHADDIINAINQDLPVILSVDFAILTRSRERIEPHYLVVTGYDENRFICNDPYPEKGGRVSYSPEELLYATARIDGDLIIIKPRS